MLLYAKSIPHPILVKEAVNNVDKVLVQIQNCLRKLSLTLIYRLPGQSADTDDKLCEQIAEISCHSDSVFFGSLETLTYQ